MGERLARPTPEIDPAPAAPVAPIMPATVEPSAAEQAQAVAPVRPADLLLRIEQSKRRIREQTVAMTDGG
ncbi:MAG: hypothetical protein ACYDAG_14570 [Chloroflexota bacterium]